MGQKTHPLGFRLGVTQAHKASWFAKPEKYTLLLQEDHKIRNYINTNLSLAGISNVEINRKSDQIEIEIYTSRPGIIIGRSGAGIDKIREDLKSCIKSTTQIRVNVNELSLPDADAALVAEFIAQQLEKRIAFKRATRQAIQKAQKSDIKGIKVQVSGRLNGAEIARSEWVREGRVPLQTIRAKIDYATKTASTIYGILGIKVWIFKGETAY